MNKLNTSLGKLKVRNPITVASGTFGLEYGRIMPLHHLGALVTKTITPQPKEGNQPPRIYETECGLLNSIGLQNPGLDSFIKDHIDNYFQLLTAPDGYQVPLIVSFSGASIEEFAEMLTKLEKVEKIAGYEINISCPNVEKEGISFGVDPEAVYNLIKELNSKRSPDRELIVKLSPNVTDITEIATAAEQGGADSLALINTVYGMAIDWQTGKTMLKRGFGGYSGNAIKPIALYNVYKVAQSTKLPLLAMGGISNWKDALEFFYAGAHMIAVGTANFTNHFATIEILRDLEKYFDEKDICLTDIIGKTVDLVRQGQN